MKKLVRVQCPYQARKYRCRHGDVCRKLNVESNDCWVAERYLLNSHVKEEVDEWQKEVLK